MEGVKKEVSTILEYDPPPACGERTNKFAFFKNDSFI
jgi:hypothetical protein